MNPAQAVAHAVMLERQAAEHKAAIWRHRRALRKTMEQLAELSKRCRTLGIKLTIHAEDKEDKRHGRTDS